MSAMEKTGHVDEQKTSKNWPIFTPPPAVVFSLVVNWDVTVKLF